MKNTIPMALAVIMLSAACTKIEKAVYNEDNLINGNIPVQISSDTPEVQVYFHIKRVAKIHEKIITDEMGKKNTIELVDEITDRLFIRCIGSSNGYRALYDLEVTCVEGLPQILWNIETRTIAGLDKEIMWIDHSISDYNDPIPIVTVTRFFGQKIAKTTTLSVIYNPLLNSYELIKLIN